MAAAISQALKADIIMILVTVLAAIGWIFSANALQGITPFWFLSTRFLLAGLILAILAGRRWRRVNRAQFWMTVRVGALMSIAMCIWIQALSMTDHVGEGSFIISLGVVFVPVIARLVFNDRPPAVTWIALPVAILGFAFISLNSLNVNEIHFSMAQWIFLTAALLFAIAFNLNSRTSVQVSSWILASVQLLMIGMSATVLGLLTEPLPINVTSDIWSWVIAAAIISSAMRFQLQTYAQGMTPASHTAVILILEPVWVVVMAVIWLGEQLSANQLVGCTLIFCALLINRWNWVLRLIRPKTAIKNI